MKVEEKNIDIIKNYNKLKLNLEINAIFLNSLKKEFLLLFSIISPSEVKSVDYTKKSNKRPFLSEMEQLKRIQLLTKQIRMYQELVLNLQHNLKELEKKIDNYAKEMNDIELIVFNLFVLKHKKLKEIAKITNYSYDRIKQISRSIRSKEV